jgi:hypothetical protein
MRHKRRRRLRHQRHERWAIVKLFGVSNRLRRVHHAMMIYREPELGHLEISPGFFIIGLPESTTWRVLRDTQGRAAQLMGTHPATERALSEFDYTPVKR